MPTYEYQIRFVPTDPELQEGATIVGYYDAALDQAKIAQDRMAAISVDDDVTIKWRGIIPSMKPWYLDTGQTFVLIEWSDGSRLVMEPVTND